ncbi:MAG: hypothetical protein ACLU80_04995 [Dorea sp.]
MADLEYVDANGRQIRVRPRETRIGEIEENMWKFPSSSQNRFTVERAGSEGKNPVEKDRAIFFSWA